MGRWERAPEVLWRSTSRGPVVLVPGMDEPTALGGLGAFIWELLDEPSEDAELLGTLSDFAAPGDAPSAELVAEALDSLRDSGLVRTVDG